MTRESEPSPDLPHFRISIVQHPGNPHGRRGSKIHQSPDHAVATTVSNTSLFSPSTSHYHFAILLSCLRDPLTPENLPPHVQATTIPIIISGTPSVKFTTSANASLCVSTSLLAASHPAQSLKVLVVITLYLAPFSASAPAGLSLASRRSTVGAPD